MLRDLRTSLRVLARNRLPSLVVLVTLALGIGSSAAIFTVLYAVVLRPLPFPEPDRLVAVWSTQLQEGIDRGPVSMADYLDWRDANHSFEALAVIQDSGFALTGEGEPEEIVASLVSPDFFPVLGVAPVLGRALLPEEETPGRDRVVVLSHGLWQRRFGGDPEVIGRTLSFDGLLHEVVGVMPAGFRFPSPDVELWTPLAFTADQRKRLIRSRRIMRVVGRLRDGVSLPAATAEMQALAAGLAERDPATNEGWSVTLVPLHEQVVAEARPLLLLLLAATAAVLAVAGANVSNLLLARAVARRRELAVRTALGAGFLATVRPVLAEALVLASVGGLLGLGLAHGVTQGLAALAHDLPREEDVAIGPAVVLFVAALSAIAGLSIGAPAALVGWRNARSRGAGGDRTTGGRSGRRLGGLLVGAEVALALALAIGSGLLAKSFVRLAAEDPGFDTAGLDVAYLSLPRARYGQQPQMVRFYEELLDGLSKRPGIRRAAVTSALPMSPVGYNFDLPYRVEGRPPGEDGNDSQVFLRSVSPDYFRTLGIPLLRGRDLGPRDRASAPRVAVINQTLAERAWPEGSAIGEHLSIPLGGWSRYEIVGVAADIRHHGLDQRPQPEIYLPFTQYAFLEMTLVVRPQGPGVETADAIEAAVWAIDPRQPISGLTTMEAVLDASVLQRRLNTRVIVLFSVVAAILAALGIYGMAAYQVGQRAREYGVRKALGAGRWELVRAALAPTMAWVIGGLLLGVAIALASTRLLDRFLYGVSSLDPIVFAAAPIGLAAVALLGCLLPARHAVRVDPAAVLRDE